MNSAEKEKSLNRYRPVPFYFLNTTDPEAYSKQEIFSAMERMKNSGYGGIVMFNKPPTGFNHEEYLSEFWFEITGHFIQAAKKLDLQLWINDGFNFPPGDAAGRIEAVNPTLKQLRLIPNPEGKLNIREVPWGFPAFEEKESSDLFIRFVYEEYYKRFAEYFGNGITGFFSDADNRRYNAHVINDCPERYYPWCKNFSELFQKHYGYLIENHLKELFNDPSSNVQTDYWEFCGDLYQKWFANNHAWCKAHNVLYTFHSSDTGPLRYQECRRSSVFTEGEPLKLLSHSDCPGTDHEIYALDGGTHYDSRYYVPKVTFGGNSEFLVHPDFNNTLMDLRAKYAQSAAVLNGKERVMCEMFAATNHGITYNELQRIAAWQIIQGINFIIPHAVHHKFHGITKYFAPPIFNWTTLEPGLRQFNDRLSAWCQAASAGEYLAEYAVIDATRAIWKDSDNTTFFRFCDQLNRRAEGYLIVPQNYDGPIKNIVDPLKSIPVLPPPKVTFSGGELAYMRRKLNNEEYLLAANIWLPEKTSGTLTFLNKSYEIELEPGEIAIIGGPFQSYRSPKKYQVRKTFSGTYPVAWKNNNLIPFNQELKFTSQTSSDIFLYIPRSHCGNVLFNGTVLQCSENGSIFADKYCIAQIKPEEGINIISAKKNATFDTPFYLTGNFNVNLKTSGDYAEKVFDSYLLSMYEPNEKIIDLTERAQTISCGCGWEKQGHPFYSGEALMELGYAETIPGDQLELPEYRGIAELLIDGKFAERCSFAPYRFSLPEGKHHLSLRLWNSMANQMERYAAVSGLSAFPGIINAEI